MKMKTTKMLAVLAVLAMAFSAVAVFAPADDATSGEKLVELDGAESKLKSLPADGIAVKDNVYYVVDGDIVYIPATDSNSSGVVGIAMEAGTHVTLASCDASVTKKFCSVELFFISEVKFTPANGATPAKTELKIKVEDTNSAIAGVTQLKGNGTIGEGSWADNAFAFEAAESYTLSYNSEREITLAAAQESIVAISGDLYLSNFTGKIVLESATADTDYVQATGFTGKVTKTGAAVEYKPAVSDTGKLAAKGGLVLNVAGFVPEGMTLEGATVAGGAVPADVSPTGAALATSFYNMGTVSAVGNISIETDFYNEGVFSTTGTLTVSGNFTNYDEAKLTSVGAFTLDGTTTTLVLKNSGSIVVKGGLAVSSLTLVNNGSIKFMSDTDPAAEDYSGIIENTEDGVLKLADKNVDLTNMTIAGRGYVDTSNFAKTALLSADIDTVNTVFTIAQNVVLQGNVTINEGASLIIKGSIDLNGYKLIVKEDAVFKLSGPASKLIMNGGSLEVRDGGFFTVENYGFVDIDADASIILGMAKKNFYIHSDGTKYIQVPVTALLNAYIVNEGRVVINTAGALVFGQAFAYASGGTMTLKALDPSAATPTLTGTPAVMLASGETEATGNEAAATIFDNYGTLVNDGTFDMFCINDKFSEFVNYGDIVIDGKARGYVYMGSEDAFIDIVSLNGDFMALNYAIEPEDDEEACLEQSYIQIYVGNTLNTTADDTIRDIQIGASEIVLDDDMGRYYRLTLNGNANLLYENQKSADIYIAGNVETDIEFNVGLAIDVYVVKINSDNAVIRAVKNDSSLATKIDTEYIVSGAVTFVKPNVDGNTVSGMDAGELVSALHLGQQAADKVTLTVPGSVVLYSADLDNDATTNGVINAAKFIVPAVATTPTQYVYSGLDYAIESGIKDIRLLGTNYVDEDLTIPAPTKIYNEGTLIIEETALVTLEQGSYYQNDTTNVYGTFYIEDGKDVKTGGTITADVKTVGDEDAGETFVIYTNFADALGYIAEEGGTVVLNNSVTIDEDTVIPENVIVDLNKFYIFVLDDTVLTIDGLVEITDDSTPFEGSTQTVVSGIYLAPAGYTEDGTEAADVVLGGAIFAEEGVKAVQTIEITEDEEGVVTAVSVAPYTILPSAYFQITDPNGINVYEVLTTIENAATVAGSTVDGKIEINADEIVLGDIAFDASAGEFATIKVYANKVYADEITLANADLIFETDGAFIDAVIANANGSFDLYGEVDGELCFTAEIVDEIDTLYISGGFDIDFEKKSADLSAYGDVAIGYEGYEFTSNYMRIAGNADVVENATIDNIKVDGALLVGHGLELGADVISVYGMLGVAPYVDKDNRAAKVTVGELFIGMTSDDFSGDVAEMLDDYIILAEDVPTVYGEVDANVILISPDADVLELDLEDYSLVTYIVEEETWMTLATVDDMLIKNEYLPNVPNADLISWENEDELVADAKKVGTEDFEVVYAELDYNLFTVTVYAEYGIQDLYLDGKLMVKDGTGASSDSTSFTLKGVTAGAHKITFTTLSNYSGDKAKLAVFAGTGYDAEVSVNGFSVTISEGDAGDYRAAAFELTGFQQVTPVDPTPIEPEKQQGLTITEILLIVLVIIIAIMAVVLILRLNRS